MDRSIRVRRPKNSPYTLVYADPPPGIDLAKLRPTLEMVRIWMAVVPPVAEKTGFLPAYGCILGETYDPYRVDRPIFLMDEVVSLNPDDFTLEEQEAYEITQLGYDNPNAYHFRRALVALKDIWWPSQVVVPKDDQEFYDFVLRTDGLLRYDDRKSERYFRRQHPLFQSVGRYVDEGIVQADKEYYRNDPRRFIDGQAAQGMFEWYESCKIFGEQRLATALRAVSMGLSEMQWRDAGYIVDNVLRTQPSGGYGGPMPQNPSRDAWRRQAAETVENVRELFGG